MTAAPEPRDPVVDDGEVTLIPDAPIGEPAPTVVCLEQRPIDISLWSGRSIWILTVCQILSFTGVSIDLTLTGIVGLKLAPSPALATLPLAMITIVSTVGSVLAGLLAQRVGYPNVVAAGAFTAVAGGALSALAVEQNSFELLCCGTGLVGLYRATGGYIRYMAADTAPPGQRKRALSVILAGGLVAAFGGPLVATRSAAWLSTEYAGSYAVIAGLALLMIPLILTVPSGIHVDQPGSTLAPVSLREVRGTRNFISGVLALAISGGVMTMIMAIGPIGSEEAGHSMSMGASIVQWHLIAMFAPSIFSGPMVERIGAQWTGCLGALTLAAGAVAGITGDGYPNFLLALTLNGAGWNLLYMAGSAMMIDCYPAGRGGRIQAVAEGVGSVTGVVSSLSASAVFYAVGWRGAGVPPLMLGVLLGLWLALFGTGAARAKSVASRAKA